MTTPNANLKPPLAEVSYSEFVRLPDFESEVRKIAKERPAEPAIDEKFPGAKYVHTFVCHGCKLDCTIEAVTDTPTTESKPDRCIFIGVAPWHLEATHTLTP